MKRVFLVVGTAVMVLPCLAGARAEAEMIPWTESVTLVGPNLSADGSAHVFSQNLGSNAQIVLSPGPTTSGITSNALGAVDLVNVNALPASTGAVGLFGGPSGNYSLSLTLRDAASGASGSMTFGGNLFGSIVQWNGTQDMLDNTFPTTQTLKLGGNLYTVSIVGFYSGPFGVYIPPFNGGGSILANISAEKLGAAPEPSSLVLACLGLPSLGLAGWFRRRKIIDSNA